MLRFLPPDERITKLKVSVSLRYDERSEDRERLPTPALEALAEQDKAILQHVLPRLLDPARFPHISVLECVFFNGCTPAVHRTLGGPGPTTLGWIVGLVRNSAVRELVFEWCTEWEPEVVGALASVVRCVRL